MSDKLANIGNLVLLINLILYGKYLFKLNKAFKIYTFYLLFILLVQTYSFVLASQNKNNLFLSHFYFVGQFILLSYFYLEILKFKTQQLTVKIGFVICLLILAAQYSLDFTLINKFNLFEIFITSFLIIIYSVFYLYNLLNEKKQFYYINIGLLLYLFGSTILFLVGNLTIILSPKINTFTWMLNSSLYIVYQVFIFVEWKKNFSINNLKS